MGRRGVAVSVTAANPAAPQPFRYHGPCDGCWIPTIEYSEFLEAELERWKLQAPYSWAFEAWEKVYKERNTVKRELMRSRQGHMNTTSERDMLRVNIESYIRENRTLKAERDTLKARVVELFMLLRGHPDCMKCTKYLKAHDPKKEAQE